MPIFEYKALDRSGKNIRGIIESDSIKSAKAKLKKNDLILTDIKEKNTSTKKGGSGFSGSLFNRINLQDISITTRQLASLVKANIPIVDALSALIEQTENEKLKVILSAVRQDVNEGSSLAKSMGKHPKVFSNVFVNMVEAGEASGTLPIVLLRLADFQESQVRLKNKISSAVMYPVLMALVAIGLVIAIFVFVIPKIVGIFESMNKPMPIQTRIMIGISDFIVNFWWLLLGGSILGLMSFTRYINTPSGRKAWDGFLLRAPVFGVIVKMIAVSRFSSTMATLLAGGVPIVTAMGIVKNIVGNTLIKEAITRAQENVTEGQSIAEPLKRSQQFPPLVIHMIAIGEKTGELPNMLQNVSTSYEEQVSAKIEGLTSLLEPAMIIFMGAIVGGIVMSIFLPLMELNNISNN
ncbi:MAG: type II secretion system inner membrane protein GspF [Bacteriovoracia bacterium]